MKRTLFLAFTAMAGVAFAGQLSTTTPNNGSGGVFIDLTPFANPLNVTSFDTYVSSTSGTGVMVEVWTRPGSYVGFDGSNAGWTLHDTVSATSAGSSGIAPVVLNNIIALSANTTTGVYLHSITSGGGIRYTGTNSNPPQTTWSNADLTLFGNVSRTGAVSFGGSRFTPRTFAGNVNYDVVPEPATMIALGAGLAALAARRRRK